MQTIDKFNFAGKKAFVRVDFNVPLDENFNITDDTRMRAALPTLKKILADGGSIIIGSHLGRPKGVADKFSLKHIIKHLSELLGVEVQFANDCMGEEAAVKAAALQPGEVLLLENLRFYAEEEGKPRGLAEDATDEEKAAAKKAVKESQKEFTKKLASYADCYVNDAFGTAHRAHASTALIAKYFDTDNKMFGYLMEKEVKAVDKVLNDIQRPFTAIMGGSKVSSKIEIIENLLSKVDNLIIAGGMTYTFTKAMGGKIGISICEDDKLDLALDLMKKAKEKGVNLVLAVDAKIADDFSNDHMSDEALGALDTLMEFLEQQRLKFVETKDKSYWYDIIQLLPESYNQKRTITMNYENLLNMYYARKNHKLDEWHTYCDWILSLPYTKELFLRESD